MNKRIGLDLDDTINYWYCEYLKIFGVPKDDYEITKNINIEDCVLAFQFLGKVEDDFIVIDRIVGAYIELK